VAYISVTAPSGASVTASCQGSEVTGSGTCTLEVTMIGEWLVTVVLDGTTKTDTVNVTAYGETYEAAVSYASMIRVTTHPGASVTATKTGQSDITGTADSDGVCELTVPAGALGEWSVTADNSETTATGTVNVASYDSTVTISLLENVPIIEFTVGDDTYTYKGAEIDISGKIKISPSGDGWKAWIKTSGTIKFTYLKTNVDLFAVGKGTGGGYYRYISPNDYAGGGGSGGQIVTKTGESITLDTAYSITVDSTGSSFGSIISAGVGGGASGGGGAATIDTGWSSATHPQYSYSSYGYGAAGAYAFGSTAFDNTEYGHGGCGGDTNYSSGSRGRTDGVYANPGAGGAGGGQGNNSPTGGNIGIILMRNAA